MNIACSFFLHVLRVFVMRPQEKTRKHKQTTWEHCYEYCAQSLSAHVCRELTYVIMM